MISSLWLWTWCFFVVDPRETTLRRVCFIVGYIRPVRSSNWTTLFWPRSIRGFQKIRTSAAVRFDVGGGGAWQVYSHRRWVTASCFMARCPTSRRAAIGRDDPRWWDLSVPLGKTNKTYSLMFYGHCCYDDDRERRIYLRGPEHINKNEMYQSMTVYHFKIAPVTPRCQKSLKNPLITDSSVMKQRWTFDSDGLSTTASNSENSWGLFQEDKEDKQSQQSLSTSYLGQKLSWKTFNIS